MPRKILQFAPFLGTEEYAALRSCFELNWITEGPRSEEFVTRLKALIGTPYAVLAPNGTLALYLGLRALDIGRGDEVIVPDFTFMGSATAVEMTGATPVFCDIDPQTLQADVSHFEKALTPHTRAIMPVHVYGMTCPIGPLVAFARAHRLLVIEDAAQAVGVRYQGQHAGTFGDVGSFSFFADKTITTGEGGLVVTNDPRRYECLRLLRNQGRMDRGSFVHPAMGYNFRLTDLQAAVGLVQLGKLEQIVSRKQRLLALYQERLRAIRQVRLISVTPGSSYIPFRVAIYAERGPELMKFMETRGIQTRTFFYPLHRQPAFAYLRDDPARRDQFDETRFPGAVYAFDNGVCLPSFPSLPIEDLHYVCDAIRDFYRVSPAARR
jgi:perosamine synthetase